MSDVKELKSIDLSSFTINYAAISVVISAIFAIILVITMAITNTDALGAGLYIIPTIIVGTLMYSIYNAFFEGFLYNTLGKSIKTIKIVLKNDGEIAKVTTTETAIITAMIATIQVILLYLVSVMILPLMISASMQTLMLAGQSALAYSLYQLLILISQPTTIAMIIFGTFIITFVFVLLGCYIYNILANTGRGVVVNLSKENNMTVVESVDMLKLAIACGVISCILSLILGIIMAISGGSIMSVISNVISGLIGGFVEGALIAIIYNYIAPKLGKLKLELIDY